jgi:hypothetical protein
MCCHGDFTGIPVIAGQGANLKELIGFSFADKVSEASEKSNLIEVDLTNQS